MEHIMEAFITPSPEFRGKPFWSWNGKLDGQELIRQIGIMKEMGFGGFFIHSRIGLVDEYMGDKWMEMVQLCVEEAKKHNLEVWLYDEDRWPSGFAGGFAVDRPEYTTKYIALDVLDGNGFVWDQKYIAVFCCDLEGVEFSNLERITVNTEFEVTKDRKILAFYIVYQQKAAYYNNSTYLDTLNINAVKNFMRVTHEKYKSVLESEFGKTIKGIFTDEATRGALLDGFAIINPNGENFIPWTYDVFSQFREKFGYDIVEKLPYLFLKEKGEKFSSVKWHYIELLQQMFINNFMKPIYEWCNEHKLILTGHLIEETTLPGQTALCGSVMRCYEYMNYPGTDVLTKRLAYASVKQLSSAARQTGKKQKLSELYGVTGWEFPFAGHKHSGDWQALLGINFRCHHLSFYTMKGDAKRDCPGSILHQSAWWKEYAYVEDYYSRIGTLLSRGDEKNELLVINPVESVWGKVYPKFSNWLTCMDDGIMAVENKYQELLLWLCRERIGYDFGDEDMLSRLYEIKTESDGTPVLFLGEACYKAVLVSGMVTIRSATLNIINSFMEAGGKVIFTEDLPEFVDGVESDKAFRTAEKARVIVRDRQSLGDILKNDSSLSYVDVLDENGTLDDILCQMRQDGNQLYLFLLNTSETCKYENVTIRLKANGLVQEWDCKSGMIYAVEATNFGDDIVVTTDFEPYEEKMYIIGDQPGGKPIKIRYENTGETEPVNNLGYKLNEPNVCVLDVAEFRINDEEWKGKQEVLRLEQSIRKQFGLIERGWLTDQPWHNKTDRQTGNNITLRFSFNIENLISTPYELVLEAPEDFKVWVNGRLLSTKQDNGFWIDICFKRFAIPDGWLKTGKNEIEMQTCIHDKMELEAIHLIGDFSVSVDGNLCSLSSLPEELAFGDIVPQGLPFYGGSYVYGITPPESVLTEGQRCFIALDGINASCVKVYNETKSIIIAYPPYEADITDLLCGKGELYLEVIPTRRNTFGPLHLPFKTDAYLPDAFLTQGDHFSPEYCLYECGLTTAPKYIIKARI